MVTFAVLVATCEFFSWVEYDPTRLLRSELLSVFLTPALPSIMQDLLAPDVLRRLRSGVFVLLELVAREFKLPFSTGPRIALKTNPLCARQLRSGVLSLLPQDERKLLSGVTSLRPLNLWEEWVRFTPPHICGQTFNDLMLSEVDAAAE